MTTGTVIIQDALIEIGAFSVVQPASPESTIIGLRKLNDMMALWLSQEIVLGVSPLSIAGDDLNEPPGTASAIVSNLAIMLAPSFPTIAVSPDLLRNAKTGLASVKRAYKRDTIPNKIPSSTLPWGAGSRRANGVDKRTFFGPGVTLDA